MMNSQPIQNNLHAGFLQHLLRLPAVQWILIIRKTNIAAVCLLIYKAIGSFCKLLKQFTSVNFWIAPVTNWLTKWVHILLPAAMNIGLSANKNRIEPKNLLNNFKAAPLKALLGKSLSTLSYNIFAQNTGISPASMTSAFNDLSITKNLHTLSAVGNSNKTTIMPRLTNSIKKNPSYMIYPFTGSGILLASITFISFKSFSTIFRPKSEIFSRRLKNY